MVHVNHHVHHHEARQDGPVDGGVSEAVSVVYVTAAKTFDGPIRGYNTPSLSQATQAANSNNGNAAQTPAQAPAPAATNNQPAAVAPSSQAAASQPAVAPSSQAASSAASVNTPSQVTSAVSSAMTSQQTTLAHSTAVPASSVANTASLAGSNAAPTAAAPPVEKTDSGSGMSSGGKAGLAIGIIAILAILGAVAFWFYRRKNAKEAQARFLDNEKSSVASGGANRSPTVPVLASTVPRAADNTVPEMNEKTAASAGLAPAAAPTTRGRTPEPEKANPFADPVTEVALAPAPLRVSSDKSRPTSPGSDKSATANAPARGPDGSPLNVHRVQLDFAPSMDDELGLKQGQLVRMLHEYDDGWCLCVRLDRSQQGVCPRSCLSKMPVKPKPGPGRSPQPNGASRPTTPQSQSSGRARASSNAVPPPLNTTRPSTPKQGPFGEGEYRAQKSPVSSISNLSNSPNQSPPSSPEPKQATLHKVD